MKKSTCVIGLLLIIIFFSCQKKKVTFEEKNTNSYATLGSIEIYDSTLYQILKPTASIEILAKGFDWVEGPVWVKEGGYLLFSDIPPNVIYKWKEGDSISVYLKPSGYTGDIPRTGEVGSNGLMLNAKNQLLLCQHGNRQIALMDAPLSQPESQFIGLATKYKSMRFNSPNDLAIRSNGDIYFTDPPYGLEKNMDDPTKEIDFQGVYRWSASDSSVSLLTDQISRPNGIAFSMDEKRLYVSNSDGVAAMWHQYDVNEEGNLENESILFDARDMSGKGPGGCDGMAIHPSGLIFATAPGGVWIISYEGLLLGKINTGVPTSNCTFDDTFSTLYMTADSSLLRLVLK